MTRIKVPGTDYEGMSTDQLWQSIAGLTKTRDGSKSPLERTRLQKIIDRVQSIIDKRNRKDAAGTAS